MHKSFPFQCIFSASLPTIRKGVHCTKVLHSLFGARGAVRGAFQHPLAPTANNKHSTHVSGQHGTLTTMHRMPHCRTRHN